MVNPRTRNTYVFSGCLKFVIVVGAVELWKVSFRKGLTVICFSVDFGGVQRGDMTKLVENIKAVIESDLDSDAVRLWLWLFFDGKARIDEVLAAPIPRVVRSLNSLVDSKRLKIEGASVSACIPSKASVNKSTPVNGKSVEMSPRFSKKTGLERAKLAIKSPRLKGARKVINEAIDRAFRAYNEARKEKGLKPMNTLHRDKQVDKWKAIVVFCAEQDIRIPDFMKFAYEKTKHQRAKFPSPSTIAGVWMQAQWIDQGERPGASHAGHAYEKPELDVRERLKESGYGKAADLSDAKLRHLQSAASIHRKSPHMRKRHRDEELEAAILFLASEGG